MVTRVVFSLFSVVVGQTSTVTYLWGGFYTGMAVFEAAFVAAVLVMMLSLLFMGWKTPEVVVRVSRFVQPLVPLH